MRIYKENGKVIVELTGYDVLFTDNSVQDTVRIECKSDDVVFKINTVSGDGISTGVIYGLDREGYMAVNEAINMAINRMTFRALMYGKSAIMVDEHTKDGIWRQE